MRFLDYLWPFGSRSHTPAPIAPAAPLDPVSSAVEAKRLWRDALAYFAANQGCRANTQPGNDLQRRADKLWAAIWKQVDQGLDDAVLSRLVVEAVGVRPFREVQRLANRRREGSVLSEDELTAFIGACLVAPWCGSGSGYYTPLEARKAARLRTSKSLTAAECLILANRVLNEGGHWKSGFEAAKDCEDPTMAERLNQAYYAWVRRRDLWWQTCTHWWEAADAMAAIGIDMEPWRKLAEESIYYALSGKQYADLYVMDATELVGIRSIGITADLRELLIAHCVKQGHYHAAQKALTVRTPPCFTLDELKAMRVYWLERGGYPWHVETLTYMIDLQGL